MIKYGLRIKGETELLQFYFSVNSHDSLECELDCHGHATWLSDSEYIADFVSKHNRDSLFSSYENPAHNLAGQLEVVPVKMEYPE